MPEPLEIVPVEPFVADQISIRRCPGGCYCLVFAFDDGTGPRVTGKVLVAHRALDALAIQETIERARVSAH